MEIEFNPSRVGNPPAAQPATKSRAPAATGGDSASLDQTSALKAAINDISLVRPEKVDAARASVSDTKFPPDAMLKAVAALIAKKMP
jgi:hypothetical protein